jgi:hypothetical protein
MQGLLGRQSSNCIKGRQGGAEGRVSRRRRQAVPQHFGLSPEYPHRALDTSGRCLGTFLRLSTVCSGFRC